MYSKCIKRFLDVVMSGIGIVILAIPMLIVILVIKVEDKGPAFFVQRRIGKEKKEFKLYKFRSMKMSTPHDMPTHLLSNPEQYLLRCGKVLRAFSIDELPQLINIFKGDMSVIGPRPALWNQFDLVEEREKYDANSVRPGLTGWAQINGRDEIEIELKAKLDGEYVKNMSFLFDCKCFFKTFSKVLKKDGVREGGTGALKEKEQENE